MAWRCSISRTSFTHAINNTQGKPKINRNMQNWTVSTFKAMEKNLLSKQKCYRINPNCTHEIILSSFHVISVVAQSNIYCCTETFAYMKSFLLAFTSHKKLHPRVERGCNHSSFGSQSYIIAQKHKVPVPPPNVLQNTTRIYYWSLHVTELKM